MLMDPLLGIPISELMNPEGKKWVENDMHQTQKKNILKDMLCLILRMESL